MSKSIATRVDEETAQWLQSKANKDDTTISAVVADLLADRAGEIEQDPINARMGDIERAILMLANHAAQVEGEQRTIGTNASGVSPPVGGLVYPPLPDKETLGTGDD